MNPPTLFAWHQTLASIFSRPPCSDSIAELLKSLEQLVNGCNSMAILYPKGQPASVTHHRLLANEDPGIQIEGYIHGAYLLDPYYRKALDEKKEGVFTLKDVAPEGFEESEYYNVYYNQANSKDEASFLFLLKNQMIASISICRSSAFNEQKFSKQDIELLRSTYPLVKCIMAQWVDSDLNFKAPSIESHLDNALENFGSSLLTPKECEILRLILHGNSVKNVAGKLDNSLETIKHHRKNIYLKLDVSTQAELFYLFIASLRNTPENNIDDPLAYYNETMR